MLAKHVASKPRLARMKSQALSMPSFRARDNQPWKGQSKLSLLARYLGELGRVFHLPFKHPLSLAVDLVLGHVDNYFFLMQQTFSASCSPISWSQELPAQLLPSGFLITFCQKGGVFGCFLSIGVWWAGWSLLDICCYRRGFLRAGTKEVLFLLRNKLLAAKQNIAKLNRTERVLHFKRLVLFWQEPKANVSRGQIRENKKSSSPQPGQKSSQPDGQVTSMCKTFLSL